MITNDGDQDDNWDGKIYLDTDTSDREHFKQTLTETKKCNTVNNGDICWIPLWYLLWTFGVKIS